MKPFITAVLIGLAAGLTIMWLSRSRSSAAAGEGADEADAA